MTQNSRALKQTFVENDFFAILQKYPYLDHGLALGQSRFPVEVSLHDDTARRLLSRARILGEPLCPKGRLAMCESTQCVRIGE